MKKVLNELGHKTHIFSKRKIKNLRSFKNVNEAIISLNPNYVIIANETSEHLKTLQELQKHKIEKIFIEKPIFSNIKNDFKIPHNPIFVGYNLRFHPLLVKLTKEIGRQKVLSVDAKVGSYLPHWRKGIDYRKNYSTKLSLGGGVLRDLSHEIDYLIWIFGNVKKLIALGGHYSSLSGDSDDLYKLILKMDKCEVVSVSLDYLNRLHQRELTVITEDNSYHVDLTKNILSSSSSNDYVLKNYDNKKTYYDQHIDIIQNEGKMTCKLKEGLKVLEVIRAAEKSNEKKYGYKYQKYFAHFV